ncbi:hypothetical protein BDU57DRAFT_158201 [Ampelomyces quisqualis]|uniref:RING-type domain-containing protein n=1 Tax=Ampelomyces quisqualis TaxID=50730 RepID=A0A6A5QN77_AMPQU|nr:hypothetical protein BDU57DRAFT_158201 [Ampelomyces quisqualis]
MPESWPPPFSVKDVDEVSTTAGDYHNMSSLGNASTEQDQDPSPGASLTAPSHPPSTEPQAAPSATSAQGSQDIGTNPPMTIPLALGSSPDGSPESGNATSQLPTPLPSYPVNAEQVISDLIYALNAYPPNTQVGESQANVPTPSPGPLQEDIADENAATMPDVQTAEYIEDISDEMIQDMFTSNTPAGFEPPPGFIDYVLSFTFTSGSSAVRLPRPRFDPVVFVNSLQRVNISDIPAEDMRCAHCWLAFGTTGEDDPGFMFTPDFDDPPELAARQVAFRELPFCAGRPDNDPVQTPCGHLFGRGCLIEIIEKMGTLCPTCRQEMRS